MERRRAAMPRRAGAGGAPTPVVIRPRGPHGTATAARMAITCPRCGAAAGHGDAYCATCGSVLAGVLGADAVRPATNGHQNGHAESGISGQRLMARRRLGGTIWYRSVPADAEAAGDPVTAQAAAGIRPGGERVRRRRRKRKPRRVWLRRLAVGIPVAFALLVIGIIAVISYRANATMTQIRSLSAVPPVVTDQTAGDEPLPGTATFDTGPAQAAVAAAADAPAQEERGEAGLFDRVKRAAGNAGDLAEGAAIASGLKDPEADALTILIMGVDARPGAPIDVGVRPDVLMVARLEPGSGSCRLLAIPRDTRVELPGYGLSKVNHALMVGGVPYQRLVVERFLGLPLDGYALLDFAGFQTLVDAVGGITVNVPEPVMINGVRIEAGPHRFDGAGALAFARYRDPATGGDLGRIKRQWAVLAALADVAQRRDLVRDVNELFPALGDHVRTDLRTADLAAIASRYGTSCPATLAAPVLLAGTRVRMDDPLLGQAVYYNVVDQAVVRQRVAELLGGSRS